MPADFPFAFAEYLRARGVDHDMRGARSRTTGILRRIAPQIPKALNEPSKAISQQLYAYSAR